MKKRHLPFLVLLSIVFLGQGCLKKNEEIHYRDFTTVTEDFMLGYLIHSETFFRLDSIFRTLDDSLAVYPSGSYQWHKATMTVMPADTISYPKSFLLDYGSRRALDSLSGKIAGTITKKYLETGSEVNYTFVDYVVDSFDVRGFDTLRMQQGTGSIIDFTFIVNNGLILKPLPGGVKDTITFKCLEYPRFSSVTNEFTITNGYASGLSTDSLYFSANVNADDPPVRPLDCPFIQNGELNFYVSDYFKVSIGEGFIQFGFPSPEECDKYAIIIINAQGYQSQLEFVMD
jgi:hypothetical protein